MTGLKAMGLGDLIAVPGPLQRTTVEKIKNTQRKHIAKLQQALADMHKRTRQSNSTTRAAGRKGHDKKQGTAMAEFKVEDFILYADVWQHTRSKLRVKWFGSAQVVGTVSN
ncbi:hypothetical protein GN958_ATG22902 [Phytophthora infestans]|uniref:Uncharacterized protein n=1 Tax=Phytophthora infestans TaxID=4787 RepID=A0A8S9TI21_PHYIN|nr:hypothetical protein GN958_ATG22902 [Phytophthora infestans]